MNLAPALEQDTLAILRDLTILAGKSGQEGLELDQSDGVIPQSDGKR